MRDWLEVMHSSQEEGIVFYSCDFICINLNAFGFVQCDFSQVRANVSPYLLLIKKLINVHQNKNLKTSNKEKAGRGQRPHY